MIDLVSGIEILLLAASIFAILYYSYSSDSPDENKQDFLDKCLCHVDTNIGAAQRT